MEPPLVQLPETREYHFCRWTQNNLTKFIFPKISPKINFHSIFGGLFGVFLKDKRNSFSLD
ncbi:hypothetical protein AUF12_22830 [Enterococcus avium]|nr:hypothetical protein AUF12_22830 [Enterococcus avium]